MLLYENTCYANLHELEGSITIPNELKGFLDKQQSKLDSYQTEVGLMDKRVEFLDEQVYLARELIEEILVCLKQTNKAKDLKQSIKSLIDASMFEI
jgi:hypothetical protein